jgi:hypothetical protein
MERRPCSVASPIAEQTHSARPQWDRGYDLAFRLRWLLPLQPEYSNGIGLRKGLLNDVLILASKSATWAIPKDNPNPYESGARPSRQHRRPRSRSLSRRESSPDAPRGPRRQSLRRPRLVRVPSNNLLPMPSPQSDGLSRPKSGRSTSPH